MKGEDTLNHLISNVNWIQKNKIVDELIQQELQDNHDLLQPMNQGYEAEVMKVVSEQDSFVLKVWSKTSRPDIALQYQVLHELYDRGYSVSQPVGWGINANGDKVLLTSFDGTPIMKVNQKKISELAVILASLHQNDIQEWSQVQLPIYDFINYFFPNVAEHNDILAVLTLIVEQVPVKQETIIHGDFHLGNILEQDERYTVIDWTNVQLGDYRYDFAWAYMLLNIYTSDQHAETFRSVYLKQKHIPQEQLEAAEALACLRWMVLSRSNGVPLKTNTKKKVRESIESNPYLKQGEFRGI